MKNQPRGRAGVATRLDRGVRSPDPAVTASMSRAGISSCPGDGGQPVGDRRSAVTRIKATILTRNVSKTLEAVESSGEPTIVTRRGVDWVAIIPLVLRLDEGAVARMVDNARKGPE